MMNLEQELRHCLEGEVYLDPLTRQVYSVDASIFEITPTAVILPKSVEDIRSTVEVAKRFQLPVTVRGAATGITGACLGSGLIVDTSKYLDRILSIDLPNQMVTCEPGVVQDNLNEELAKVGFRLGPDTSTGNRATLGGMLANNAAGSRSIVFGRMIDHIVTVELLVSSGELLYFSPITLEEWKKKNLLDSTEGTIYRTLWTILHDEKEEIEKWFPKIPRHVSGYPLDELLDGDTINVAKLIAGSEGTLGIVTTMTLKIIPKIRYSGLILLFFDDRNEAFKIVPELLHFNPSAIEMIDNQILEFGRQNQSLKRQFDWLEGETSDCLFIVEMIDDVESKLKERIEQFHKKIKDFPAVKKTKVILEKEGMSHVWALRKSGLGILLSKRSYSRAIAFLEDISVSPLQLAPFMSWFSTYLEKMGKKAGVYGHVGSGCMHIRPFINLQSPTEWSLMQQMMSDVSTKILEFGGSLSGEHGDGLIRSWLNPKMFGNRLIEAFRQIKTAFDPMQLMNPGKIISTEHAFDTLRLNPDEKLVNVTTFLDFQQEGGFTLAVDLCNGNGLCRKKEKLMCPSFQATNEEFHSTRARAQALRSIIHGKLPIEDLTGQKMYDVMDLCLSCKGCKTECPSQVDMAKMKAEFLYHYQEEHGYSWRSWLFANIGMIQHFTSKAPSLFNSIQHSWLFKKLTTWIGISDRRQLPELAPKRFSEWFNSYKQPDGLTQSVVLFNDTFNEFNHPEVGQSALMILNQLGYKVIVPHWHCCGRPALSKGHLRKAREQAKQVVNALYDYAKRNIPIIGLEPSCILTLTDDYLALLNDSELKEKAEFLITSCVTFDQFLYGTEYLNLSFIESPITVKVHGHCHQKALVGMTQTMSVLRSLPGVSVSEIASGCCGMAGSFGYEAEHYDISMKIGNLVLFPAIEGAEQSVIVADGTSCRQQIWDGVDKRSYHLAEFVYSRIL